MELQIKIQIHSLHSIDTFDTLNKALFLFPKYFHVHYCHAPRWQLTELAKSVNPLQPSQGLVYWDFFSPPDDLHSAISPVFASSGTLQIIYRLCLVNYWVIKWVPFRSEGYIIRYVSFSFWRLPCFFSWKRDFIICSPKSPSWLVFFWSHGSKGGKDQMPMRAQAETGIRSWRWPLGRTSFERGGI